MERATGGAKAPGTVSVKDTVSMGAGGRTREQPDHTGPCRPGQGIWPRLPRDAARTAFYAGDVT